MKPITYLAIGLFVGVLVKSATSDILTLDSNGIMHATDQNGISRVIPTTTQSMPFGLVEAYVVARAAKTKAGEHKSVLVDDEGRVVCAP